MEPFGKIGLFLFQHLATLLGYTLVALANGCSNNNNLNLYESYMQIFEPFKLIWRNFKSLAIFEGLLSFWQNLDRIMAIFHCCKLSNFNQAICHTKFSTLILQQ